MVGIYQTVRLCFCLCVCVCVCVCSRHYSIISSQQKKSPVQSCFLGGGGRENEQMSLWSTTLFLMFLMFHYLVPDCQSAFSESVAWIKLSGGFPASEIASRALGRAEKHRGRHTVRYSLHMAWIIDANDKIALSMASLRRNPHANG